MPRRDGRAPTSSKQAKFGKDLKLAKKEQRKRRLRRRLTAAVALRRVMAVVVPLMIVALSREFPKDTVNDTCRFLVKAGVQTTTLTAARENAKQGKSRRQMWRTLQNLSKRKLQRAITNTIREQVRPWLPKVAVDLAIDLHLIPYAGITALTSRLLRSQAKQGTNRFHGYSTAYIAYEDHRFTIGCRWVVTRRHLFRIIEKHLKEAEELGLKVRRLLLDREFYSYGVLTFLESRGISYIMPPRSGKKMEAKWKRGRRSYTTKHTVKSPDRKKNIEVTIQIVVRYKRGRIRGERGAEYLSYVVGGRLLPPKKTRELYRRRFGIETSYRKAEEGRPRTNSHDPSIRFIFFAVAVIVENEWVIMKLIYASERRRGRKGYAVRTELLRFGRLVGLLLQAVRKIHGEVDEVSAEGPPPRWVAIAITSELRGRMAND
jgi:putative transposase